MQLILPERESLLELIIACVNQFSNPLVAVRLIYSHHRNECYKRNKRNNCHKCHKYLNIFACIY